MASLLSRFELKLAPQEEKKSKLLAEHNFSRFFAITFIDGNSFVYIYLYLSFDWKVIDVLIHCLELAIAMSGQTMSAKEVDRATEVRNVSI